MEETQSWSTYDLDVKIAICSCVQSLTVNTGLHLVYQPSTFLHYTKDVRQMFGLAMGEGSITMDADFSDDQVARMLHSFNDLTSS